MSESVVFYSKDDDAGMIEAFKKAQSTFKYFWRELSWEYRRIVPALQVACVKVAFQQTVEGETDPVVEHMWINDINFDGEHVYGTLVNNPNNLTNVKNGDFVEIPLGQISDWLFACQGKTYGGFTIQHLRSGMDETERKSHDEAWGMNFGDYTNILLAYEQEEHPENLEEHPMCVNMGDSLSEFLDQNPAEITGQDEMGYAMIHREAIAGNKLSVEMLLKKGADRNAKTSSGKTALDFANEMGWEHVSAVLQ